MHFKVILLTIAMMLKLVQKTLFSIIKHYFSVDYRKHSSKD